MGEETRKREQEMEENVKQEGAKRYRREERQRKVKRSGRRDERKGGKKR